MKPQSQPVTENDTRHTGAGVITKCFYCPSALGTEHAADCVCRKRTVMIEMRVQFVRSVPADWTPEQIEFHMNESSWCSDNGIDELDRVREAVEARGGCMCMVTDSRFVREATEDDERDWMEKSAEKP